VIIHGDARLVPPGGDADLVVIDPPWDSPELFRCGSDSPNRIVFADGFRAGDAIRENGPPTWVFVWDCVSSWYTQNRPLKRMKLALWYGRISDYNPDGYLHGGPCGKNRVVTNTRGAYLFEPASGKHLSDVYQQPITSLRAAQVHGHSKPIHWLCYLLANCSASCSRVVDLFAGSGAVGVAAKIIGKNYAGFEIDKSSVVAGNAAIAMAVRKRETTQEELQWPSATTK